MTWIAVNIGDNSGLSPVAREERRDKVSSMLSWCGDNLSSNGVLWKYSFMEDYKTIYFAQPQDAVLFKLKFNV